VGAEDPAPGAEDPAVPASPESLFGSVQPLPDGALAVLVDGRALKISNWDKVLFPRPASPRGI